MKPSQACLLALALAVCAARPARAQDLETAQTTSAGPRRAVYDGQKNGPPRKKTAPKITPKIAPEAAPAPSFAPPRGDEAALPARPEPQPLRADPPKPSEKKKERLADDRDDKLDDRLEDGTVDGLFNGTKLRADGSPRGEVHRNGNADNGWHGNNPASNEHGHGHGNGNGNGTGNGNGNGTGAGQGHGHGNGAPGWLAHREQRDPSLAERVQAMLESGMSWSQIEKALHGGSSGDTGGGAGSKPGHRDSASGSTRHGHDGGGSSKAGSSASHASRGTRGAPGFILKAERADPALTEDVQALRENGLGWKDVAHELGLSSNGSMPGGAPAGGGNKAPKTPGAGGGAGHGAGGARNVAVPKAPHVTAPKPAPIPKQPKITTKKGK